LDNIEEIIVNGADATPPANGTLGGDTILVFGDFTQTSLNLNTITINGTTGDDTVDISALSSAHRIVFRGEGGNDTIVGTLRPQDVINLPGIGDPTVTAGNNGMVTVSRGGASVTFDGSHGMPEIGAGSDLGNDEIATDDPADTDEDTIETVGEDAGVGEAEDGETEGETDDHEGEEDQDNTGIAPPLAASGNLIGTAAGEALFGTADANNILALDGRDMVFAGDGDDNVLAGGGRDMVFGDGGNDRLFGEGGDDFIEGGTGNDFVVGGSGDDWFVATTDDGDDVYYGDDVSGGTGTDTLDMSRIIADITVDLGSGSGGRGHASSAASGNDVLWSVENFIGGAGDDVITAGRAQNMLDGGAGNDVYRFLSAQDADGDTIGSFQPGDKIDLSQIDANGSGAGTGNFTLVSGAFTGGGQLLVTHEATADGEVTVIHGNIDGDTESEFSLSIRGRHNLTEQDFQL